MGQYWLGSKMPWNAHTYFFAVPTMISYLFQLFPFILLHVHTTTCYFVSSRCRVYISRWCWINTLGSIRWCSTWRYTSHLIQSNGCETAGIYRIVLDCIYRIVLNMSSGVSKKKHLSRISVLVLLLLTHVAIIAVGNWLGLAISLSDINCILQMPCNLRYIQAVHPKIYTF